MTFGSFHAQSQEEDVKVVMSFVEVDYKLTFWSDMIDFCTAMDEIVLLSGSCRWNAKSLMLEGGTVDASAG